jgi:hypothetical protein
MMVEPFLLSTLTRSTAVTPSRSHRTRTVHALEGARKMPTKNGFSRCCRMKSIAAVAKTSKQSPVNRWGTPLRSRLPTVNTLRVTWEGINMFEAVVTAGEP